MNRHFGILIVIIVFNSVSGRAQFPFYINYDINSGLPSSEIYDIVQDSAGNIWLGTSYGVSKFDGYRFQNFTTSDGLAQNSTIVIYKTNDRIWFLAYNRMLSYFKDGHFNIPDGVNQQIKENIHPNNNLSISIDQNNNLYFLSEDNKLVKLREGAGLTEVNSFSVFPRYVHPIYKKYNEPFYYALFDSTKRDNKAYYTFQNNIYLSPYSNLGYFTGRELIEFRGRDFSGSNVFKILHNSHPLKVIMDNEDNVWYRYITDGIYRYKYTGSDFIKYQYLKDKRVTRVFLDREDNHWFCTEGDGLYKVPSLQFNVYNSEEGLVSQNIISIACYDSVIFCGTNTNLLYKMVVNEGRVKSVTEMFQNEHAFYPRDIFIDKKNSVWILTSDFLHYNFEGKDIAPDFIVLNKTYSASGSVDGDVLIATEQGYLKYKDNRLVYDSREDGFSSHLHVVCQLADSSIFLGGLDGLYRRKDGEIEYLGKKDPLMSLRIMNLQPLYDGLLIGTRANGLAFFDGDTIVPINKQHGLCSDIVSALYIDNENGCWVGTTKGLNYFRFNRQKMKLDSICSYTIWDGLPSNKINDIVCQDGNLWIATDKGIASINPNLFKRTRTKPIVIMDSVIVNDNSVISKNSRLNSSQNTLAFYYTGISFRGEGDICYKIKLEGIDNDWVTTQNKSSRYSGLKHGAYIFKVKARNIDGDYTENPVEFPFFLKRHFTQSWWFFLILFLLGAMLLFIIAHLIIKSKINREENKRRIIQSEQKALRSQMNPHFIFNSLNSIQDFVLGGNEEAVDSYLSDFSALMRNILEYSKENFIWLNDELDNLKLYLALEQLRFEDKFEYVISIEEGMDTSSAQIPPMILQPYIENAIHHGIMHKQGKGKILINIFRGGNHDIFITIEDNGVGRKRASEIESLKIRHNPMGMRNTEERVNLINQIFRIHITVEVEDMFKGNDMPAGTKVKLNFPEFISSQKKNKRWVKLLKRL